MRVFEMHLQVNQRLQEVASYKRDKFKPEEIDMALNKAMFRLLEQGVDSNFEDAQINLGHVAALIQKNSIEEVIIPGAGDPLLEDNQLSVYAVLPADFYWLLNSRVEIITDPVNCGTAPSLATTTKVEYVTPVAFPTSNGVGVPPYFSRININSSTVGTLYNSPSTFITASFNSYNSNYVVIQNIIESFSRNRTYKVYWERYRDTYYPGQFIFVSAVPLGTVTVTLYRSDGVTIDNSTTGTSVQNTYNIYNRSLIANIVNKKVFLSSATNKNQGVLYDVLTNNTFYYTRGTQPVLNQTQDYLVYYLDKSFLITRSYFDYIRKPRTISLALNQGCELADPTHPKIIDLAVEILRLDTKDKAYPATVQDTQTRTN